MDADKFFLDLLSSAALTHALAIGCRTKLIDHLSDQPISYETLAENTCLHERYVKEWLGAMVCGGIVHYKKEQSRYCLSDWLTSYLGGKKPSIFFTQSMMLTHYASLEDSLVSAMRQGTGIPYEKYGEKFYSIITEIWKPIYDTHLTSGFLDKDKEIINKMKSGSNVLEIGCGRGNTLHQLGEKFPLSQFTGVELSVESIRYANKRKKTSGNVHFRVDDAHEVDYTEFDIVIAFDTVHDLRNPMAVLQKISRSIRDSGIFIMLEFNLYSYLENNIGNPYSVLYYVFSLMHCIPVSFSNNGAGLGATWGREETNKMLTKAGFSSVKMLDTPRIQNCLYVCRV